VGAYGASSSAGKSYVIFGKTDTESIDLSKLSYPLITKPPMPAAMSDKSIAVLSFLPNTTYDLPTPYFLA
jgi:hypothetical protein